jgi:ketosteroid isomerase-like protein
VPARTAEELCELFQQYMSDGNLDAVLSVYEDGAVFRNREGALRRGLGELRQELAPFANARARFDFTSKGVIAAGDIALMHTEWRVSPQNLHVHAIEVAHRQTDGTCLIGDPFTVGDSHVSET